MSSGQLSPNGQSDKKRDNNLYEKLEEYYKKYELNDVPVKDPTFPERDLNRSLTNSELDKLESKIYKKLSKDLQPHAGNSLTSLDSNIKFFKITVQNLLDHFYDTMHDFELYKKRYHEILAKKGDDIVDEDFLKDIIHHIIISSDNSLCIKNECVEKIDDKRSDGVTIHENLMGAKEKQVINSKETTSSGTVNEYIVNNIKTFSRNTITLSVHHINNDGLSSTDDFLKEENEVPCAKFFKSNDFSADTIVFKNEVQKFVESFKIEGQSVVVESCDNEDRRTSVESLATEDLSTAVESSATDDQSTGVETFNNNAKTVVDSFKNGGQSYVVESCKNEAQDTTVEVSKSNDQGMIVENLKNRGLSFIVKSSKNEDNAVESFKDETQSAPLKNGGQSFVVQSSNKDRSATVHSYKYTDEGKSTAVESLKDEGQCKMVVPLKDEDQSTVVEAFKNEYYQIDSDSQVKSCSMNSCIRNDNENKVEKKHSKSDNPSVQMKLHERNPLSETIFKKKPGELVDGKFTASAENMGKRTTKKLLMKKYSEQESPIPTDSVSSEKEIPVKVSNAKRNILFEEETYEEHQSSKSILTKLCDYLCGKFRRL